jgi:hypothetical protein
VCNLASRKDPARRLISLAQPMVQWVTLVPVTCVVYLLGDLLRKPIPRGDLRGEAWVAVMQSRSDSFRWGPSPQASHSFS